MATIRELIVQKALERVNTGLPGGVPATERARTFAMTPDQLIKSTVYPLREETRPRGGGVGKDPTVQTGLILAFELRAKGDGVSAPDVLLDPTINWIVKQLALSQEAGLWATIDYLDTDFQWAQAEYALCIATVKFRVSSQMKTNDPSALS